MTTLRRFLLVLLLLVPSLVFGANFITRSWHTTFDLKRDRTFQVTERIEVEFTVPQHGLIRRIPFTTHSQTGGTREVQFRLWSVLKEGQNTPYQQSVEGDYLVIKIGSGSKYVEGKATYEIKYSVVGGLTRIDAGKATEHDELYWIAAPLEWATSIQSASLDESHPPLAKGEFKARILAGPPSSRWGVEIRPGKPPVGDSNLIESTIDQKSVHARLTRDLPLGYGMTLIAAYPKGTFDEPKPGEGQVQAPPSPPYTPEPTEPIAEFNPVSYFSFGLAPLLLLPLLDLHLSRIRPKKGPLVVQFEPPTGTNATDAGYLLDGKVDQRDVVAGVIEIGQMGGLRIEATSKKGHDLRLIMMQVPDKAKWPTVHDYLHAGLISFGMSLKPKDLKGLFWEQYQAVARLIQEHAAKEHWIDDSRAKSTTLTMFVVIALAVGILCTMQSMCLGLVFGITALSIGVKMVNKQLRWTQVGEDTRMKMLGLREFITRANEKELNYMSRVDPDQALFEKLLPYAVAFNAVTQWTGAFDGINLISPAWYNGPGSSTDSLNLALLLSDLDRTNSNFGTAMYTAPPRTSSSGESFSSGSSGFGGDWGGGGGWDSGGGFSGGGDVGGGGGGGGGDSW